MPKKLTDITYFPLEKVNKHGFIETMSPQSILLVPSFPRMKSGNMNITIGLSIFKLVYVSNFA